MDTDQKIKDSFMEFENFYPSELIDCTKFDAENIFSNQITNQKLQTKYDDCLSDDASGNTTNDVLLIQGASGSGKSWFLKQKYSELLQNWIQAQKTANIAPFPIYINLEQTQSIFTAGWCARYRIDPSQFQKFIINYPVILLLDTYDGMPGDKHNVVKQISDTLDGQQ